MDINIAAVIIVIIFALVIITAFMFFRNTRATIDTPLGKLEIDGSNDVPPKPHDIEITDAKAGDDILAENEGDGGIGISNVETEGGIVATNKKPADPKANPPA